MNMQQLQELLGPRDGNVRTLTAGHAVALGAAGGRLDVLAGRVWLTRSGDLADHVVDGGQTLRLPASGNAVIEALSVERPALIAWHPRTWLERLGDAVRAAFGRCWDVVDPARRVGIGALAALAAMLVGAVVFGPLSDARTRALAEPALLHNSAAIKDGAHGAAAATRGHQGDVGAGTRERARLAAQEARRRSAGAA